MVPAKAHKYIEINLYTYNELLRVSANHVYSTQIWYFKKYKMKW